MLSQTSQAQKDKYSIFFSYEVKCVFRKTQSQIGRVWSERGTRKRGKQDRKGYRGKDNQSPLYLFMYM